MRAAFIPWIALSAVVVGSGEIALPCESLALLEKSEAVETITRDISLAEHARAESLESFSGAITLHRDSHVTGNVESDFGTITLDGAHVGGLVSTTYGDIYVGPDSHLEGGILVNRRGVAGLSLGDFQLGIPVGRSTPPRVVIGARVTVAGVLRFKRKVELLVSESATIGPVEGATPVRFATEQPPN